MTTYRYEALDAAGTRQRATIESTSIRAARASLSTAGLQVTSITEKRRLTDVEVIPGRIKREEIMHVSRQLAAFLRAGIPMLEALECLADGADNPRLTSTLHDMRDGLREGETFAEVVASHPRAFPAVYRGMVESAELTGHLDEVLEQLAGYLERDEDTRRDVRSAMTYPSIVVGMAILTVVTLSVFVMPKFETFFDSMGATLPLVTRMLLGATGFLSTWWWAVVTALVFVGAGLLLTARSERGRMVLDRALLGAPILGETIRYAIIERFCRTLGAMVRAGVPLPDAMLVAGNGTNNAVYARGIDGIREGMVRGEGIARPVVESGLFPNAMTQMIRAGEATGTLDDQLETAASYFGQELRFKIKRLVGVFEPAIIVFVGLVVGFVAIALVSAMYGIFRQVGP